MTSIKDLGPGTNDQHRIMWSKIHPLSMASAVPTVRYRNYPSQGTGLFPTKDQQAQFQGLDPQPRMASRRRLASMYPGQSPLFGPQSRDRYGLCTRYIGMHVPSRSTPEAEASSAPIPCPLYAQYIHTKGTRFLSTIRGCSISFARQGDIACPDAMGRCTLIDIAMGSEAKLGVLSPFIVSAESFSPQ